jgi:hypothetical protein
MQEQNTNNKRNGWKIATIALAVVSVVLAGTTMLFAVRSVGEEKEINQSTNNKPESSEEKEEVGSLPDSSNAANNISDARYLTVTEWGMKFLIPEEFSELTYKIKSDDGTEFLNFDGVFNTIPRIAANQPDFTGFSFGTILRVPQNNDPNAECKIGCAMLMGTRDSYNYYFMPNQNYISAEVEYQQTISKYLMLRMVSGVQFI